jgi:glycosyltransferase involved in cell wall biosynthesis
MIKNNTMKNIPKKHLIYVIPKNSFFNHGDDGSVMHALGVAEGFAENGWSVNLLSGDGLLGYKEYLPDNVKLTEIDGGEHFLGRLHWPIRLMRRFKKQLKSNNVDVFLIRYAMSKYFLCWLFCSISRRQRITTVLEVNSFAFHHAFIPNPIRWLWGKAEILLSSRFDIVYAVSKALSKSLQENKCATMLVTVPNGASSNIIEIRNNEYVTSEQKLRFIYLGTLLQYYDFTIIIAAFQIFVKRGYDCELHFYGGGKMEQDIRKVSAKELQIVCHGKYKKRDISTFLNRHRDVLIMPPVVRAHMARSGGLSTKLFEYMSLKLPIIAPAMGEINDIFKDRENAVLYEYYSEESLADAFELIATHPQIREKISLNAFSDFIDKHTWRARMSELIGAFPVVDGKASLGKVVRNE